MHVQTGSPVRLLSDVVAGRPSTGRSPEKDGMTTGLLVNPSQMSSALEPTEGPVEERGLVRASLVKKEVAEPDQQRAGSTGQAAATTRAVATPGQVRAGSAGQAASNSSGSLFGGEEGEWIVASGRRKRNGGQRGMTEDLPGAQGGILPRAQSGELQGRDSCQQQCAECEQATVAGNCTKCETSLCLKCFQEVIQVINC